MTYHYTKRLRKQLPLKSLIIVGITICTVVTLLMTVCAIKLVEVSNDDEIAMLEGYIVDLITECDAANRTYHDRIVQHQLEVEAYKTRIEQLETEMFVDATSSMYILKKYDYVIDVAPVDGGVSYALLEHVDQRCKEKNVNPHLVWGIVNIESSFDTRARNAKSDARGFGQFLKSTGKSIYENYLGLGPYNHDYAYDPYVGLEMIIEYLHYLTEYHRGNVISMIQNYSGDSGMSYYNKLASQMKRNGYDISVISYI